MHCFECHIFHTLIGRRQNYIHDIQILTGAFLSIGLITNFLSLNEMFLISLHGKPIFGESLKIKINIYSIISTFWCFLFPNS